MDEKKVPAQAKPAQLKGSFVDPGVLLSNSWQIYKDNWTRYVFLSALPYLSIIPFVVIAILFVVAGIFLYGAHNYVGIVLLATIGIVLAVVYFTITFSIGGVALIYLIHDRGKMSIKESLKKAWGIIWSYWWVGFLVGMLTFGGYMLFIIPGIIFSIWFIFSGYVLIFEGAKGMDALVKSREYVKGRWWGVLGRLLLVSLITSLVSYVPQALFQAFDQDAISSLVQIFVSLAVTPFTAIYMILMYEDLKTSRPEVATIPTKEKGLYIVVAVLGFVLMLVVFYFGVKLGIELLRNMPSDYYKTAPNFQKEIPNFT